MISVREDIVAHLRSFLAARHPLENGAALDESTALLGRGIGLDSVEALQLVSRMEEAFGLTIGDEELDAVHFQTVGTFVRFIEDHVR
jgi:acyl carrier protein